MNNEYRPDNGKDELPEWLVRMKKERSGMKVPEGYFDKFPDELMKKLKADKGDQSILDTQVRTSNIRRLIAWTTAAAASILLLVTIWNSSTESGPQYVNALSEIPVEQAMAYLIDNIDAYSWRDIVDEGMTGEEEGIQRLGMDELSDEAIIDELYEEEILELL